MNTLVIYSAASLATNTVRDYVEAFGRYLPANVFFEPIEAEESLQFGLHLDLVDLVIIHYSANFQYSYFGNTKLAQRVSKFKGVKILFTQDDYDWTAKIHQGIASIRPNVVYSVLPPATATEVYRKEIDQGIKFENCLTGYVPSRFEGRALRPITERSIDVGYRGRTLPVWYGKLGFEKIQIGDKFKQYAENHDIAIDIESDTAKRIYGADWDRFLQDCRTMLASESGCNVFDLDGSIREQVISARRRDRTLSDSDLYNRFVREYENQFPPTNQLSPKMFEAVAFGTVLVMFEGSYSDVFEPGRHYLPLKKDFSNFDEVVEMIRDTRYLQKVADLAYEEIIESRKYSYEEFCKAIWKVVDDNAQLTDHSPVELTETVARRPFFRTVGRRFDERFRRTLWAFGKSIQYIKEWGFGTWLRKLLFFVRRKIRLTLTSLFQKKKIAP